MMSDSALYRRRLRQPLIIGYVLGGIEMGSPADVILRVAGETASDLIVIGARGAGALARLATHFGSIAHKVVSRAACPVLTVGGSRGSGNKSHPA